MPRELLPAARWAKIAGERMPSAISVNEHAATCSEVKDLAKAERPTWRRPITINIEVITLPALF